MGVRVYSNKPRVYIDMDGVLANYDGEAKKRNIDVKEVKLISDVYRKLEVMPYAQIAVNAISKFPFELWVLSKCPKENPNSATDKILWLHEHFPFFEDRIILTSDKGCVGSEKDYLIDDHPEWANANAFPGTILIFQNNWIGIVDFLRNESVKYENE